MFFLVVLELLLAFFSSLLVFVLLPGFALLFAYEAWDEEKHVKCGIWVLVAIILIFKISIPIIKFVWNFFFA